MYKRTKKTTDKDLKNNEKSSKEKSLSQFVMGQKLGEGMFGKVRLATHILTGEKVAIKILEKAKILEQADKIRVEREIRILKQLKHTNIIQLYSVIQTTTTIYLVMEYSPGKELFDYIVNKRRLSESESCEFFQQIVSGVDYMHKNRICHRDLKPENMLLDSNRTIKIIDFGLSNAYGKNELLSTACGSPCYAAPEMIAGNKYSGLKIDIWSIGIILYAMVCGYLPFEDTNNDALYNKILEGRYAVPSFVSESCKELIKRILTVDHNKRITIQEIKEHAWFKQRDSYLAEGLLINTIVIPIDEDIVNKLTEYKFNKEEVRCSVLSNKHNHLTTSYYLMVKSKTKKEINSVSDLISKEYLDYIHNDKNLLSNYNNDINEVVENLASSKGKFIDPERKEKKNKRKCIIEEAKSESTDKLINTNNIKENNINKSSKNSNNKQMQKVCEESIDNKADNKNEELANSNTNIDDILLESKTINNNNNNNNNNNPDIDNIRKDENDEKNINNYANNMENDYKINKLIESNNHVKLKNNQTNKSIKEIDLKTDKIINSKKRTDKSIKKVSKKDVTGLNNKEIIKTDNIIKKSNNNNKIGINSKKLNSKNNLPLSKNMKLEKKSKEHIDSNTENNKLNVKQLANPDNSNNNVNQLKNNDDIISNNTIKEDLVSNKLICNNYVNSANPIFGFGSKFDLKNINNQIESKSKEVLLDTNYANNKTEINSNNKDKSISDNKIHINSDVKTLNNKYNDDIVEHTLKIDNIQIKSIDDSIKQKKEIENIPQKTKTNKPDILSNKRVQNISISSTGNGLKGIKNKSFKNVFKNKFTVRPTSVAPSKSITNKINNKLFEKSNAPDLIKMQSIQNKISKIKNTFNNINSDKNNNTCYKNNIHENKKHNIENLYINKKSNMLKNYSSVKPTLKKR